MNAFDLAEVYIDCMVVAWWQDLSIDYLAFLISSLTLCSSTG